MPLDSTDTSSKAGEGKFKNGPNFGNGAEVKLHRDHQFHGDPSGII